MLRPIVAVCVALMALGGCATSTGAGAPVELPWLDEAFDHRDTLVTVGKEELFRLPDELARIVDTAELKIAPGMTRLRHLTAVVHGPDKRGFTYVSGNSTTAAQTWARRAGDCLSLTVLAYATARALGLASDMQEVQTPIAFDRTGRFDVLYQHVNLVVSLRQTVFGETGYGQPTDVVIDFDPNVGAGRRGMSLTEDGILSRYYNNIAVEHLTADRQALAYAHFRAAIKADPTFAAPYASLAILYRAKGFNAQAEQLLNVALRMSPRPDLPLRALHDLMEQQGRTAEAKAFARQLEARQAWDPYYWTGRGVRHLEDGEARRAVNALERARELAPGFPEVRRYLAVAYVRNGNPKLAAEELKALESMQDQTKLAWLRRKLLQ